MLISDKFSAKIARNSYNWYLCFLLIFIKTDKLSINITIHSKRLYIEPLLFGEKSKVCREKTEIRSYCDLINLQHKSVLKAQPQQRISNIYIYLYASDQSMYIGSDVQIVLR